MEDEQPKIDDDAVKELPQKFRLPSKEHEENQKKNADSDETSKKDEGSERKQERIKQTDMTDIKQKNLVIQIHHRRIFS